MTHFSITFARLFKIMGFLLLSLSLTRCAVGPDYMKTGFLTPLHWKSSGQDIDLNPPVLAQWWQNLNDPVLNQLIVQSINGNNDVASAKARIREARANVVQSQSTLFPNLDGNASYDRNRSNGGPENGQYGTGLTSSWEIDLFGANRRAVEASKYGLDAAREDLHATLVILIADVATNYVRARGYQAQLALARRTAASQQRTADLTRDKFTAGAVSQLDLSNAEGQLASTQAQIPQIEANLAITLHRLAVLSGQAPGAVDSQMRKTRNVPQPKWPVRVGIPADILLNRPDLRVFERQYAQSTARIGQAEADRYPRLSLSGNISTNAAQIGDLARNSTIGWSWGPGLSVPLFSGGQRQAAVEIARAQRDQSFIAYRAAVLTSLEEVENAIISLYSSRQNMTKLNQATQAYRQSRTLSQQLYENGSTSFLELLTADRQLYSAETSLIESRVTITTNYISLMKALGGGWSGVLDTSKPEVVDRNTGPHIQQNNQQATSLAPLQTQ